MGILERVKLGERHSLRIPGNGIAQAGVTEIRKILQRRGVSSLAGDNPEWEWCWRKGGKGEYVGTLPKRIAKWCYQKHQIKLPDDTVAMIGNIGNQHCDKATTVYFDWTKKFDWKRGDFGDEGSCFFGGCHDHARAVMVHNGCWGLRFYEDKTFARGVGRSWVIDQDKFCLVCNGYWRNNGCSTTNHGTEHTMKQARILAQWLDNAYYHQCNVSSPAQMYFNGHDAGEMRGIAIAVGPQEIVADMFDYNVPWTDPTEGECEKCGKALAKNQTLFHNGDIYCKECYAERFCCCQQCGRSIDRYDAVMHDGYEYCQACYNEHFFECKSCGETHHYNRQQIVSGDKLCMTCYTLQAKQCSYCENFFYKDRMKEFLHNWYCEACHELKTYRRGLNEPIVRSLN